MGSSVDLSIALEWENPRFAGWARGRAVLRALARQVSACTEATGATVEVLLAFDPGRVSAESLRALAVESFPVGIVPRLIAEPGAGYYRLKNVAVAAASHPVVIMLDSDTVPEEGWLAALADAISRKDVDVVGGVTTVARDEAFSRAVSRFWFFPRRTPPVGPLRRVAEFWANNVAFRREVFVRFGGFPEAPLFRGQCCMLAGRLSAGGVAIWVAPAARTVHPPPRGILPLAVRGWHHGRDASAMRGVDAAERSWRASARRVQTSWAAVENALSEDMADATVSRRERILTVFLAAIYFGCKFAGERWTVREPQADAQQANS